jgi:hypothetical protein
VKQGFAEHFQNLNPEPAKVGNHGDVELKHLNHDKVKISNKFKE